MSARARSIRARRSSLVIGRACPFKAGSFANDAGGGPWSACAPGGPCGSGAAALEATFGNAAATPATVAL